MPSKRQRQLQPPLRIPEPPRKLFPLWRLVAQASLSGTLVLAPCLGAQLPLSTSIVNPDLPWWLGLWRGELPWVGIMVLVFGIQLALLVTVWGVEIWRFPVGRLALPLLALLGWLGLSVLFSSFKPVALNRFALWMTAVLFLFVLVAVVGRGRSGLIILTSIVLAASVESLIVLQEYGFNYRLGNPGWRVFGTFFNSDFLAGYLVMTIPVTLGLLVWLAREREKSSLQRVFLTLLSASLWLQMSGLLWTGSRIGLIAGFGALTLFLGLAAWWRWLDLALIGRLGLLLTLVVATGFLAKPAVHRLTPQAVQRELHSGGFRLYTWKGTLKMALQNPVVGTGIGTFEKAYPAYAEVGFTRLAHNTYLEIAAEAGLPALLLLLLFGINWMIKVSQPVVPLPQHASRPTPSASKLQFEDHRPLRLGVLAGVVGAVLRNGGDSDIAIFANLMTLFALLGLGITFAVDAVYPIPIRPFWRWVAGIGFGLLLGGHFLGVGVGAFHAHLAARAATLGEAERSYRIGLAWDPTNSDYLYALAGIRGALGDQAEALRYLQQAIRYEPSARRYYQLGLFYESTGARKEAEQAYQASLQHDPHSLAALLRIARLQEATDSQKALNYYERIVAIEKSLYNRVRAVPEIVETAYAFAHLALGTSYEKQGKLQQAEQEYHAALRIFEDYRTYTYPFNLQMRPLGLFKPDKEQEILQAHLHALDRLINLLQKRKQKEAVEELLVKKEQLQRSQIP